jgi:hypothetical protein
MPINSPCLSQQISGTAHSDSSSSSSTEHTTQQTPSSIECLSSCSASGSGGSSSTLVVSQGTNANASTLDDSETMHQLPRATINRICAGQVVVDVGCALKELIEYVVRCAKKRQEAYNTCATDWPNQQAVLWRLLVRNSLDGNASNIQVALVGGGMELMQVIDNGSGIDARYRTVCAKAHYTSKLAAYESLATLTTYGFRGEGLHSICSLAKEVCV